MDEEPRVPADLLKVNLSETWEVDYWMKALGATEQDLREAIQNVGRGAEDVRRFLSRKDPPPEV